MTYRFAVSLCGGWAGGTIEVKARNSEKAYDKAMDLVFNKLVKAFPELEIDYYVEEVEE